MKGKNIDVFLPKKVGGALIRVGALNGDYTVVETKLSMSRIIGLLDPVLVT